MRATPPPSPSGFRGGAWLAGGTLAVAVVAAYHNSLGGPFVFDDFPAIVRNPSIRHLWPLWDALNPPENAAGATGRPLANLSLALNYAAGGLDVRGYHLVNLALHLLTTLTLWAVLRRTFSLPALRERFGPDAATLGWSTALLWGVHPLLTESVVCVVQRNEVLAGLSILLSLHGFIRASSEPAKAGRWKAVAVASCVGGVLCKEVVAMVPLLVLLYDRAFVSGTFRAAWRRHRGFYAALAGSWLIVGWLVLRNHQRDGIAGFGLGVSGWDYLLTQCRSVTNYLRLALWPSPLVVDYGLDLVRSPAEIWPQGALLLTLAGLTGWWLWRGPRRAFPGAWFFLILAPSSSFLPLTTQTAAEHRMYLPLAAVSVGLVLSLHALAGRRTWIACLALAVGLGALTVRRNHDYRDEFALWSDTIAKLPANARAHASLAGAYAREARWVDAIPHYDEALLLRPDFADAQNDLGLALTKAGRLAEAIPHHEAARRLKPDDPDVIQNLGTAYAAAGRWPEAAEQFAAALARRPEFLAAHENLARALVELGRLPEALPHYGRAVELSPGSATARNQLGLAFAGLGRWDDAIAQYRAAAALAPDDAAVHVNWAAAALQRGETAEAILRYREALRLEPDVADIAYNLGNVLLQANRLAEALEAYAHALRLQPAFAGAHHNLALALVRLGRPDEAIPHYMEAVRLLPQSAAAHHNFSLALAALGRLREAATEDETALRIEPGFTEAREHLQRLQAP